VKYLTHPSEKKPEVDPSPYTHGITDLFREAQSVYDPAAHRQKREQEAAAPPSQTKRGRTRFSSLDFYSLVLSENLTTEAQVIAFVKQRGDQQERHFVAQNTSKLVSLLADAQKWDKAELTAKQERQTALDCAVECAQKHCKESPCEWHEACVSFFERNSHCLPERELKDAVLRTFRFGPSKVSRTPFLTGPTNCGKSLVFEGVNDLFEGRVLALPPLGAPMALSPLHEDKGQAIIFWDEFRPVPYFASGTLSVTAFLKLFAGQQFQVQVSQSFRSGHPTVQWKGPCLMTGPEEGLWDLQKGVSQEDIRHIKSRVHLFRCDVPLDPAVMKTISPCGPCFSRWLLDMPMPLPRPVPGPPENPEDSPEEITVDFF
jgi:hypothetical protein